ncbi:MAG: response regulator [Bacillota bacterium]
MEKYRIVVVDDEALTRLDIKEMLLEMGHVVAGEGRNGVEAVELAEKLKPELIIMDVKMPHMDGLKAAKLISGRKLAPVLLLTAYSDAEVISKSIDSGVMGYLTKPVMEHDLGPAIRITVRRYREMAKLKTRKAELQQEIQSGINRPS